MPTLTLTSLVLLFLFCLLPNYVVDSRSGFAKRSRDQTQHRLSRSTSRNNSTEKASYRYFNNDTESFFVESLPDVPFDLNEMYSGLIPIDYANTSEALFFVFQPKIGEPVDEITIWLNGGPGCSSLEGFLQEVGPYMWQPGMFQPLENPYSWVNLTNVLWVDQPLGTGYSIGTPKATTQEETALDFIKFFKNFELLFGIRKYKIYVTGESYAGRYVPYISAAMLDQNDTEHYDLSGALMYDATIGQFNYQEQLHTVPFIQQNNNILNLNSSFLAEMEKLHQSCGYADYVAEYFTFPASGVQPPKYFNFTSEVDCDIFDMVIEALAAVNPCFDDYDITQRCPMLWSVLGPTTDLAYYFPGSEVYFDRADVKKALHAPVNNSWVLCAFDYVYLGDPSPEDMGDISADPIQKVLPKVIEATNRVLVSNGDDDFILMTNGTLLSIQNMTWNGKLGFEERPSKPINITLPDLMYQSVFDDDLNGAFYGGLDGPQGTMGVQHYERGLMWAETFQAGHHQPGDQPRVAYRHLMWVLGRTDVL